MERDPVVAYEALNEAASEEVIAAAAEAECQHGWDQLVPVGEGTGR